MIELHKRYSYVFRGQWIKRCTLELSSDVIEFLNVFKQNKFNTDAPAGSDFYYDSTKNYLSAANGVSNMVIIDCYTGTWSDINIIVSDFETKIIAAINNWKTNNQYSAKPTNTTITI